MFVDEKQQGEGVPVKVGTLKLSEAMRVGARLRPQAFVNYFTGGGSCAIGAAYEAATGRSDYESDDAPDADEVFPQLAKIFPGSEYEGDSLEDAIWEKNDIDQWSREKIADWLESHGY